MLVSGVYPRQLCCGRPIVAHHSLRPGNIVQHTVTHISGHTSLMRQPPSSMQGPGNMSTAVSGQDGKNFDTAAYNSERLKLDQQAMSAVQVASETTPPDTPGAWKWALRKGMWDYMEQNDIARFPRPVHHRIPNFEGADKAAERLVDELPEFRAAQCIKANPDTPQKMVRHAILSSGKRLLTPQPRLRTGFFSSLSKADLPTGFNVMEACSSAGAAKHGQPLSLDAKLKVDMIVVGSSCVDPANGARLGKGEGFAELEYGMLRWMGAIDDSTLVVTTVHDCQVLQPNQIDPGRMLEHDVPVDIIVTPTRIIRVEGSPLKKPPGILWHRLSPQKLAQIRVLQQLKQRIEKETGVTLPTGPDEKLPPLAERKGRPPGGGGGGRRNNSRGGRSGGRAGSDSAGTGGRGAG